MKSPVAKVFPVAITYLLGVFFQIVRTVPLTIPTDLLIELVNASHLTPLLFPSLNITSLDAGHFDALCAPSDDDETWYNEDAHVKWRYDTSCYGAMQLFSKERARHGEEKFEFLAPEAQATSELKTMQTPRRYTNGKRLHGRKGA